MGDADENDRLRWYRPSRKAVAEGQVSTLAYARAYGGARSHQKRAPSWSGELCLPEGMRERDRLVADATARWLQSKGMQVFGTIATKYPLSIRQHVAAGRLLQDVYQVACGERPTVMVPCQRNPKREGYHSHPSLFGSVRLQEPRRDAIWADLVSRLSREPGMGVETVTLLAGRDTRGDFHYRTYLERGPGCWHRLAAANEARVRLEPVRSFDDCLGYAVRYASRETDHLEVLVGDRW